VARRGRESFQKRAREKARQEKQADKRARREAEAEAEVPAPSRVEEDVLMREFASLSARYEANQISHDRYEEERHRIFVQLGIEDET
jgi:hypothetical protein